MRIISKFKDYYDCVQKHGMDKSIVYVREPREIRFGYGDEFPDKPTLRYMINGWRRLPCYLNVFNYSIASALIGFCGEWYTHINIKRSSTYGPRGVPGASISLYSYAELVEFVRQEKDAGLTNEILSSQPYSWNSDLTYETMFDMVKNMKDDLFIESGCSIITISNVPNTGEKVVEFNGSLRRFDFMRVKDPFQAYQDLSMYIGGVLGAPEKETIKIDDDCMRDKKGFDKWSFRKQSVK